MIHISRPGAVWCAAAGVAPAALLLPLTLLIGATRWGPLSVGVLGTAGFFGLCLACLNGYRRRSSLLNAFAAVLLCCGLVLALPWAGGLVFSALVQTISWREIWLVLVFVAPCVVAVHYLVWFASEMIRPHERAP
jgi:hypothetical protein